MFRSLTYGIILLPMLCLGDSIGVYAPKFSTNAIDRTEWRKTVPQPVGIGMAQKVQALYDMMCERVDLMRTNYEYSANKQSVEIAGCPSVARRRTLKDAEATSAAAYEDLYDSFGDWLSRDASVPSMPKEVIEFAEGEEKWDDFKADWIYSTTNVYPKWQSPLCHAVDLKAGTNGITTCNTDCYPCTLSRLGGPAYARSDVSNKLASIATEVGAGYSCLTNGVTWDNIDTLFCSFSPSDSTNTVFVDSLSHDVISWNPIYSMDRIMSDLSSHNVAVVDVSGDCLLGGRKVVDRYTYQFDSADLCLWLTNNHYVGLSDSDTGIHVHTCMPTVVVTPNYSVSDVSMSSPSVTASADPYTTAASGTVTGYGYYDLQSTGNEWTSAGVTTSYGVKYRKYYRTAYTADPVYSGDGVTAPSVSFTTEPSAYISVTKTVTCVNTNRNDVFCTNPGFYERPEYFDHSDITLLARARKYVTVSTGSLAASNVVAYSTAVSTNAHASGAINEALVGMAIQEDEMAPITDTNCYIVLRMTPKSLPTTAEIREYKSVVVNSDGSTGSEQTFACIYDGKPHYPAIDSTGSFAAPDTSAGVDYASSFYNGQHLQFSYSVPFTSYYGPGFTAQRGSVSKTLGKIYAVCENEYNFTGWSGHVGEYVNPRHDIGPQEDYGDGDGGVDDFDVWVDINALPNGDGSKDKPFNDLDVALASINPNGGARANTNRVPKVGMLGGRYPFPAFLSKRLRPGSVEPPAYDVRLIGIGTGVTLVRDPLRYFTGHYTITQSSGDVYYMTQHSRAENLTFEFVYGTRYHGPATFTFVNCRFKGQLHYRDEIFGSCIFYNCHIDGLEPVIYDSYSTWYKKSPMFNGVVAYDSVFEFNIPTGQAYGLCNNLCYLENTFVRLNHIECLQAEYDSASRKSLDPIFSGCTIWADQVDQVNQDTVPISATNCLFFIDGIVNNPPYTVDNIMDDATNATSVIDTDTYVPNKSHDGIRAYGYKGFKRKE